jgi:DNA-binding beta-propeller fold protein YncE
MASDQASGNVYVADSGNNRIEKFDANGNFIAAWGWGVADGKAQAEVCTSNCQAGIAGSGPGQLSGPNSVATSSTGKVFVGDAGNQRVEKFDADGNFLATIDGPNTPQGHFACVGGVAVDQSGNLWTADS